MQRRLCSAILVLEAVVLGLTTPVLVQEIDNGTALFIGLGLAVLCVLTAGMLRAAWAYHVGWAVQVAAVALGFITPVMFALGAIFFALWLAAFRLGRMIDRDRSVG